MKNIFRSVTGVALLLCMLMTVLGSCGKKNDSTPTETEPPATEEQTPTPDPTPEVVYKEQFSCTRYNTQMSLKLTDTEAYFEINNLTHSSCYATWRLCANAPYSVDDNGNIWIDRYGMTFEEEAFGLSVGTTGYEVEDIPLFLYKSLGTPMYVGDDVLLMKLGVTNEKFIYVGPDMEYIEQNTDFSSQTEFDFLYVDGSTGECKSVSVAMTDVILPDTSTVGDAVIKVNYDGKQHEVACYIYPEGNEHPFSLLESQYVSLETNYYRHAEAITRDTTYEEFFNAYTGTDPLFYYREWDEDQHKYVSVPVTDYTVEGWDTASVADGDWMWFRVVATIGDVTYRHVDRVRVVDDLTKGTLILHYSNLNEFVKFYGESDDILCFVAKGTALTGVTAELEPYTGAARFTTDITVSGYNADQLGAQLVTLSSDRAANTCRIVVYVYEPEHPILIDISLPDKVTFTNGRVDLDKSKLTFRYSDGSKQEHAMSEYPDLVEVRYIETTGKYDLETNSFKTTVDGKEYTLPGGAWRSYRPND